MQVKSKTSDHETYMTSSHVMQYSDVKIDAEQMEVYQGFDPANENVIERELPEVTSANT